MLHCGAVTAVCCCQNVCVCGSVSNVLNVCGSVLLPECMCVLLDVCVCGSVLNVWNVCGSVLLPAGEHKLSWAWVKDYSVSYVTHCNTLQHTAAKQHTATHCTTLQHTAAHCSTLQHTAAHCSTLQHTATHCSTLQHTATRCNTLQHTATQMVTGAVARVVASKPRPSDTATHSITSQYIATY